MAHGPNLNASIPYEGELVHSLHDAELLWVAESILPSGRSGGRSRGGFAMQAYSWTTIGYGGYGAPIVADDKVFVFVHEADHEAIETHPETDKDPFVKLGVEKASLGTVLGLVRDTVRSFDAQTGQLLWTFHGKTGGLQRESKSGMASTPCYYAGNVYVRGQNGLYALDAKTGKLLWQKGGSKSGGYGIHGAAAEGSVVVVDGTLVLMSQKGKGNPPNTIGIDPKSGEELWAQEGLGNNSVGLPGIYREIGKAYLVLGRIAWKPGKRDKIGERTPDTFAMVDPVDGKILWESDALKAGPGPILVEGNIAVGNGVAALHDIKKNSSKRARIAAASISTKGAKPLWINEKVHQPSTRNMSVLHQGHLYIDSRETRFSSVDLQSGELLRRLPHIYSMTQGSHNWTWHIAAGDRIFTSGVGMFSTADHGFQLLPGRLSLDITSGYRSPTKPAFSDGRLFLRLADKLVCYDVRRQPKHQTQAIVLTAKHAVPAAALEKDRDVKILLRDRGDQLISAGAKWGRVPGKEQWKLVNWAGSWTGAMAWRKTHPHQLQWDGKTLRGPLSLRLGWQTEAWNLDLTRSGNRFEGKYVRKTPALAKPLASKGSLSGRMDSTEEGYPIWVLSLDKAVGGQAALRTGELNESLGVHIVLNEKGEVSHGWAVCGRMNTVSHEVDARDLKVSKGSLEGEIRVIVHDDQYQDMHIDRSVALKASAVDGPALGLRFNIKADAQENGINGHYEGFVGAEISIEGEVEGEILPEDQWLFPKADKS